MPPRKQSAESNTPDAATTIEEQLLAYLHASLDALTAQARLVANLDWLARQSAKDLALLHGVHNDKVVRLLYALRLTDDSAGADDTSSTTRAA